MSEIQHEDEEHMEQDPPLDEEGGEEVEGEVEEEEEEEEDDGTPAVNIKLQNVVATVNFGCQLDLVRFYIYYYIY